MAYLFYFEKLERGLSHGMSYLFHSEKLESLVFVIGRLCFFYFVVEFCFLISEKCMEFNIKSFFGSFSILFKFKALVTFVAETVQLLWKMKYYFQHK